MNKAKTDLTKDLLLELFDYDREAGKIFWRVANGPRAVVGAEAGCVRPKGRTAYQYVKINGSLYLTHRLIWLIETGDWPEDQIDHIDGDGLNNHISNLRSVTNQENHRNARMQNNNTSGVTGVCWDRQKGKWVAQIRVDGMTKHLGLFENLEDAKTVRLAAEKQYGFSERHGVAE